MDVCILVSSNTIPIVFINYNNITYTHIKKVKSKYVGYLIEK